VVEKLLKYLRIFVVEKLLKYGVFFRPRGFGTMFSKWPLTMNHNISGWSFKNFRPVASIFSWNLLQVSRACFDRPFNRPSLKNFWFVLHHSAWYSSDTRFSL
jgi:hypothetical protein